jgi:hypothetical protein
MTAWDWAVVAAVGALTILVIRHLNPADDDEADDRDAWQASTATRTEDDVRRDIAETKAALEIAQLEAWLHTPLQPRNTIPHQTRRTEEDR